MHAAELALADAFPTFVIVLVLLSLVRFQLLHMMLPCLFLTPELAVDPAAGLVHCKQHAQRV